MENCTYENKKKYITIKGNFYNTSGKLKKKTTTTRNVQNTNGKL